ncbi:MAG TPA: ankyrin repeat domain-containing protein, partial [Leptospiraceae bacterium]|nr:ankyrin repeat domain-containing protein [Leptospiraceae bacterium]
IHSKELVSFFLDRGFPVDQKNRSGKTGLHIASEKGFCEIAELLIQKGASVNAFEHKKDEKWPMLTPLHYASWKGNICIIKKLINNGAGLSFLSESGFTPLHSAASAGKTSAAEVLLSAGADLLIEDRRGRMPFHTAFENDRIQTGLFLLEKTLEKSTCSFQSFRNGFCLKGRFSRKIGHSRISQNSSCSQSSEADFRVC